MEPPASRTRARLVFRRSPAIAALLFSLLAAGECRSEIRPLAEVVRGLPERAGLHSFYPDENTGALWLRLPAPGEGGHIGEYLHYEGLVSGLGSNPVGLDRGQLGETRVVRLRRVGHRVLIEQPNLAYRALSRDPNERRAVEESFATSVLWAGEIAARGRDGSLLVDLASFLVRDAHGVAATLGEREQGSFQLDADRSAVDFRNCLAFPENLEFEAILTFAGSEPGDHVRETAPDPESVTLRIHHSLLQLPPEGYEPRPFDPRSGGFAIGFSDYAAPLDESIERRWVLRHRLEKTDPAAARSPVREPIVYYVDRGAPEPVRQALLDGARWWVRAFEEAGFVDAFRVELLPEDAHPLDARYHVIQWVHRSTRGWSYGGAVWDPRTGEVLKGHVSLGSLRVRQDRLLFEGLAGVEWTGSGRPDDPIELSLARIRQLAAHEVGHTLGLAHNFAASTYGDRASVMDYPAPLVRLAPGGGFDFSDAYGVGVGAWDVHAIRFLYAEPAPGESEAQLLDRIVSDGIARGLVYLTDADARPAGAAEPRANLWDNGGDPAAELERLLAVRERALARFGRENVRAGTPLALLQEVLAPLYFHHRYQVQAAGKLLGGLRYDHAVRGDGRDGARPVAAESQRRALAALLAALEPARLDLPDRVIALLLPRPPGHDANRELFASRTRPAFDPLAAAASAAGLVVDELLQPERAARIVDQHRRDPALPALSGILDALVDRTFPERPLEEPRRAEIRRAVQAVVTQGLIELAGDAGASPAVRARAEASLRGLAGRLDRARGEEAERAHRRFLAAEIERHLDRRRETEGSAPAAPEPPPGSPIGGAKPGAWPARIGCGLDAA